MCQHSACAAETQTRSKDCDVNIADRMGSRDAFPIPFPSFIYDGTIVFIVARRKCDETFQTFQCIRLHRNSVT